MCIADFPAPFALTNPIVCVFVVHPLPGNSNSVAHLIDNEIPLAHRSLNEMATFADPNHPNNVVMTSPNGGASTTDRYPHLSDSNGLPEDMDIVGGVLMENGGMMSNHRSGSYSNLYPDGDLSQQQQQLKMGDTEGHYSNLPQLSLANEGQRGYGGMRHSIEDVVDATALATAQQHVYSNINGGGVGEVLLGGHPELEPARESSASVGNGGGLSWQDTSSSTLMADDMDLDDLSTVATAFQGKTARTKKAGGNGSGKSKSSDSSVSSASSRPLYDQPEMTSTPLKSSSSSSGGGGKANKKHMIPIVAVIETSNNVNNVLNCPRPDSSSGGGGGGMDRSGQSQLNGSKLQMLHDTTMIDCALDLDSLDTVMDSGGTQSK